MTNPTHEQTLNNVVLLGTDESGDAFSVIAKEVRINMTEVSADFPITPMHVVMTYLRSEVFENEAKFRELAVAAREWFNSTIKEITPHEAGHA